MAATPTGTPVEVVWASGANPAAQSVTIPADATAVYMFWAYWASGNGNGLLSATLNSAAPSQSFELPIANTDEPAAGVCAWYLPATGSRSLDVEWDVSPTEGPLTIVAFTKDGDTTAWRDADADAGGAAGAVSVTLTTVSGELVLKFDQRYSSTPSAYPSNSASWTSLQVASNTNRHGRLAWITASGATQDAPGEDEDFSSVVAIVIPDVGAAGQPAQVRGRAVPGMRLGGQKFGRGF